MVAGYVKSITEKTENFWLDVSMGHYEPSWKAEHKFARNSSIPNGAWATVANLGTSPYPFPTTPTTVRIKAGGNVADDAAGAGARSIRVYGINSDMEFATEDIVTAGVSASAPTSTSWWRVHRAHVVDSGAYATPYNTGAIVVENSAGTADLLRMEATEGETLLGVYSVPDGMTAVLLNINVGVDSKEAADIRIFQRGNFDVVTAPVKSRRLMNWFDGVAGQEEFTGTHPTEPIVGPADVWFEARGDAVAASVSLNFELFLYPSR
jgi:hypothetical protein